MAYNMILAEILKFYPKFEEVYELSTTPYIDGCLVIQETRNGRTDNTCYKDDDFFYNLLIVVRKRSKSSIPEHGKSFVIKAGYFPNQKEANVYYKKELERIFSDKARILTVFNELFPSNSTIFKLLKRHNILTSIKK